MRIEIEQTKRVLEMPLQKGPRLLLILGVFLVAGSFVAPLWNVAVSGPGISPSGPPTVHTFHLASVPPAIVIALGAVTLLFVRAAVIGTFRSLVDSFVLYFFFSIGALWLLYGELSRFGRQVASIRAARPGPGLPNVLFGRWENGGVHFAASPGAGAWTLAVVALVLASALYVAWRNARRELTTEYLIAG
jgi:hypothetical protein